MLKFPSSYKYGDVVVIYREPQSTEEKKKLLRKLIGPFVVPAVFMDIVIKWRINSYLMQGENYAIVPAHHMQKVETPEEDMEASLTEASMISNRNISRKTMVDCTVII